MAPHCGQAAERDLKRCCLSQTQWFGCKAAVVDGWARSPLVPHDTDDGAIEEQLSELCIRL
jgi:hypothetical protein